MFVALVLTDPVAAHSSALCCTAAYTACKVVCDRTINLRVAILLAAPAVGSLARLAPTLS